MGLSREQAFSRAAFERAPRKLLHRGQWCNADCWIVELGGRWVVKDFGKLPLLLRWTAGAWLARRERRFLARLAGSGCAPEGAFLVDRYALAERFVEGRPLRSVAPGELPAAFFERAEALVREMHRRGVAHLDLRNAGNILVSAAGEPVLLDFQSAVSTRACPAPLRRRLERIDLSGVYKHWARLAPGTLGEARERVLVWQLRARRWWRLRGYRLLAVRQRPLKDYELALFDKYERA